MKTIKEVLKGYDHSMIKRKLYPWYWFKCETDEVLTNQPEDERYERFCVDYSNLIETILGAEPEYGEDRWILLTVHTDPGYLSTDSFIDHILVSENDVLTKPLDEIEGRSFCYASFEELASFYVADTFLTQEHLEELLIYYLHKATFTGYYHENMESELKWLANPIVKEFEEPPIDIKHDPDNDPRFIMGDKPAKRDPRHIEACRKYAAAADEFTSICHYIELEYLRSLLTETDK